MIDNLPCLIKYAFDGYEIILFLQKSQINEILL